MAQKRIPPSERTSQRIGALLKQGLVAGPDQEGEALASAFVRLAVRRVIEELLEAEVRDELGRDYYQHRAGEDRHGAGQDCQRAGNDRHPPAADRHGAGRDDGYDARERRQRAGDADTAAAGYRNGYRPGRLKTAEGPVEYAVPQVSDRARPFRSRLRALLRGRTDELERLGTEMYARGLSTRDIEAATRDEDGRALLSRTAVSQVTETLWEEYEAFATRDLSEFEIAYLFLDGLAERLHPGQRKEAVLCAWGLDFEGKKHLLHLTPGTKEDTESVRGMIEDLKRRGLRDPLLVTTDGAGGLMAAVEEAFPRSLRQRCLAHKQRNLESKVPENRWPEFKAHATACYQAPSPELARALKGDVVQRYEKELPAAVQCFGEDFEACIAQLRFPLGHRKAIRTTNLLERLFGEERRRTKVLPHAFGERPLLKLMFAATLRASQRWRGLKITNFERAQLAALREQLDAEFKKRHQPAVRSTPSRISSKTGT